MSEELDKALMAADWWTGRSHPQPDHSVIDAFRVLSDEVRRLQEIVADYGHASEDDENV